MQLRNIEVSVQFCSQKHCGTLTFTRLLHLTCLLRNLYAGQEATIKTGHGTMDWLQIGKGVHQGFILLPW